MAVSYINVTPEVILWALDWAPEGRVDEKTRLRALSWANGEKKPTIPQLREFSKKTCVHIGSFFCKEPPSVDCDLFRCRAFGDGAKRPSLNLADIITDMEFAQGWMSDYMQHEEYEPQSIVGSAKETDDVVATAGKIREYLELDNDWAARFKDAGAAFRFLKEKTDRCIILVMTSEVAEEDYTRPLDPEEFRAFSIVDEWAPLIFVNENDGDELKLFSLLHEIVHVWLGKSDLFDWNGNMPTDKDIDGMSETERFCFSVATELLLPKRVFLRMWGEYEGCLQERVEKISREFNCDISVVARRARDYSLVSEAEYEEIAKGVERKPHVFKRRKTRSESYYDLRCYELSASLLWALCSGIFEGYITYTEAFHLTNTDRNSFHEVVKRHPDKRVDKTVMGIRDRSSTH